jgi:hypothetical protein
MGKSTGTSSAVLTPEQKDLLTTQTNALKETFLPAYQKTIGDAGTILSKSQEYQNKAAMDAYTQTGEAAKESLRGATGAYQSGMADLNKLFDPAYEPVSYTHLRAHETLS